MQGDQKKPERISRKGSDLRAVNIAAGNADRDALLRETYRLSHELGYVGFRDQYINDSDAIKEWPEIGVRERKLRSFWDKDGKVKFAAYRDSHADVPVEVLTAHRDQLRAISAGSMEGQIAYYHRISELGRSRRMIHDGGAGEVKAAATAVTPHADSKQKTSEPPHPWPSEIAAGRQQGRQNGDSRSSLTPPAGWSAAADQHQAGNEHDNGHDKKRSM